VIETAKLDGLSRDTNIFIRWVEGMHRVRNVGAKAIPALVAGMTLLLVMGGGHALHAQAALPAGHSGTTTPAEVRAVAAHLPLAFVDASANAYFTGLTYSTDFPTTVSALRGAYSAAGWM
jgi:hypothetical protein